MLKTIPRHLRGRFQSRPESFGRSVLGAPLDLFLPANGKIIGLVVAGQHGNEPETTVLVSSVLRSVEPSLLCCAVVTSLNPDGLSRGTRCNANGVDLNHNFPAANWSAAPAVYSWNDENPRDTELSPGNGPGSEPETQALIEVVRRYGVKTVVSLHAPLGCIDDPKRTRLGTWLANTSGLPLVSGVGYATPGSLGAWGLEHDVSVITLELPFDTIQNHRRRYTAMLADLLTDGRRWL